MKRNIEETMGYFSQKDQKELFSAHREARQSV